MDDTTTQTQEESQTQGGFMARFGGELTGAQRKHLRALGHPLHPVVLVGQKGLSENLMENVERALLDHELIKVKAHDADAIEEVCAAVVGSHGAVLVQKIGKTMLFYRAHPKEPTITLP